MRIDGKHALTRHRIRAAAAPHWLGVMWWSQVALPTMRAIVDRWDEHVKCQLVLFGCLDSFMQR
jgi:hypothetical protein